jgi:hypothetical protein
MGGSLWSGSYSVGASNLPRRSRPPLPPEPAHARAGTVEPGGRSPKNASREELAVCHPCANKPDENRNIDGLRGPSTRPCARHWVRATRYVVLHANAACLQSHSTPALRTQTTLYPPQAGRVVGSERACVVGRTTGRTHPTPLRGLAPPTHHTDRPPPSAWFRSCPPKPRRFDAPGHVA